MSWLFKSQHPSTRATFQWSNFRSHNSKKKSLFLSYLSPSPTISVPSVCLSVSLSSYCIYTNLRLGQQSCCPEKLQNTKEYAAFALYVWPQSEETHRGKTLTYTRFAAWAPDGIFLASSLSNSTFYLQFSAAEGQPPCGNMRFDLFVNKCQSCVCYSILLA